MSIKSYITATVVSIGLLLSAVSFADTALPPINCGGGQDCNSGVMQLKHKVKPTTIHLQCDYPSGSPNPYIIKDSMNAKSDWKVVCPSFLNTYSAGSGKMYCFISSNENTVTFEWRCSATKQP